MGQRLWSCLLRLILYTRPYNALMTTSAISALSPLDGRYAAKLAKLRPVM